MQEKLTLEQISEDIMELFRQKKFQDIRNLISDMEPADIAVIMDDLEQDELPIFFRILPKELAADTFVELDADNQENLIKAFNDRELKEVLDDLFVDDTVDIIEEMPANVVKRILANSDHETRYWINRILKYPEDSAGSMMTIEYVSLVKSMSVKDAFLRIKNTGVNKETIYTCYVMDSKRKLIGMVSAKDLLLADPDDIIENIMETNLIYAETDEDQEIVARRLQKYDLLAIPVVDKELRLVGIITVDDAMDILTEANTEDISIMAAVTPTDKPYLKTGVFRIWANRIPWLLILMISATFTGLIINAYESTLNNLSPLLFACIPMLMDTGGNAGSQASVTVIRGLALNELEFKDIFRVQWKEIRVSILLALTLGVACFLKLLLIDNLLFGYSYTVILSAVVSFALFATVVIAKFVGCTLPLLAKKCKLDPAVVASPFITTIVDALSLLIYCFIAMQLLA